MVAPGDIRPDLAGGHSLSTVPGSALDEGYIVWCCWELKRKFRIVCLHSNKRLRNRR
jgi:hypothetical protein